MTPEPLASTGALALAPTLPREGKGAEAGGTLPARAKGPAPFRTAVGQNPAPRGDLKRERARRSSEPLWLLESGEAKSLKEIAAREGIDKGDVSRMVNLTTLAPDIVAAILDDTPPNHVMVFDLAVDPPALWDEQRARIGL